MPEPTTRSRSRSWVDRLTDWIDRLPFPPPVFYAAAYGVLALTIHGALWLDGVVSVGTVSLLWLSNAAWLPTFLAWVHHLKRVTKRSLVAFEPAVADKRPEFVALRARMIEMPARPVMWITVTVGIMMIVGVASDPAFVYEGLRHPLSYVLAAPALALSYSIGAVVLFLTARLLRSVTRAYDLVDKVNVLHQRPLYAFSILTMQAGLFWLLIANLSIASNILIESDSATRSIDFSIAAFGFGLAFLSFLLPLRGIHGRLVDAKSGLLEENGTAVDRTKTKLYAALEEGNHPEVESLDKALSGLFRLRGELERIPTWPWRPGTLRTFLSAVGLPLIVWSVQQVLTRTF